MKIYWDGYGISGSGSGIHSYASHLLFELQKKNINPEIIPHSFTKIKASIPFQIAWKANRLVTRNKGEMTIIHGLSNFNAAIFAQRHTNLKNILTVHDIIPIVDSKAASFALRQQLKCIYPKLMTHVDLILCDSRWTMETLVAHYPGTASKLYLLPLGFPAFRAPSMPKIRKEQNKTRLLTIGRHEPYKNLELLLNLVEKNYDQFVLTVVTDRQGMLWAREKYATMVAQGIIVLKTQLSQADLEQEYREAEVYCHPSSYEGFGLPIAEAASFGLPVVYMTGSGSDETALSGLSIGIKPDQPIAAWLKAIQEAVKLGQNPDFLTRVEAEILKRPTWTEVASNLASIYNSFES